MLLVTGASWLYLDWKTSQQVETTVQRLKREGYSLSAAELAPGPVPDDENAAVLYQQVFRVNFDDPRGSDSIWELHGGTHLVCDYLRGDVSLSTMRPYLTAPEIEQALETLRRASLRPTAVFDVPWEEGLNTVLPHYARYRDGTRWLSARALLDAHEGNADAALGRIETSMRMSQHAMQEPNMTGLLVAIAMQKIAISAAEETLSDGPAPSPAAARSLRKTLRSVDLSAAFKRARIGEATMRIDLALEVAHNAGCGRELLEDLRGKPLLCDPSERLAWYYHLRIMRPVRNADAIMCMEDAEDTIRLARGLPRLRQRPRDRIQVLPGIASIPRRLPVSRVVGCAGVWERARSKVNAAQARLALLHVALDLAAYRDERGEYPKTLAALEATLNRSLPEDPCGSGPLLYRREGEDYLLYSVGPDGDDDGGHGEDEQGYYLGDGDVVWDTRPPKPPPPPAAPPPGAAPGGPPGMGGPPPPE